MTCLLLALIPLATCNRSKPAPSLPAPPARLNLLDLARGASVVSRTGELMLDNSAVMAIDGDDVTAWTSPPGDLQQTLVYSLDTRSRVDALKIVSTATAAPFDVVVSASSDAKQFAEIGRFTIKTGREGNRFAITPIDMSYIRIETNASTGRFIQMSNLELYGQELQPPRPSSITGCWVANGFDSRFAQYGAHVQGRIQETNTPILLEGGIDGRLLRFVWTRGADHGFAAMTLTPASDHFTALKWHDWARNQHIGGTWFGERRPCAAPPMAMSHDVIRSFLDHKSAYPLYGLQFDERDQVVETASEWSLLAITDVAKARPCRLAAREARESTAERNKQRATRRLTSLRAVLARRGVNMQRIEFVALGSEALPERVASATSDALYSAVEISLK